MTGIDTAIASLLASRIDSLLTSGVTAPGSATAQTGASALTVGTPTVPAVNGTPPASAQTALSEIGLTLVAISGFGGEATPAVVGEVPIWPAPPAINVPSGTSAGPFPFAATGQAAPNPAAAASPAAAAAALNAATVPVAALAAALEQTVSGSGLFYESHLAQWLAGGRTIASLANEPQTQLAAGAAQLPLPLPWGGGPASDATLAAWLDGPFANVPNPNDAQHAAGGAPGHAAFAAQQNAMLPAYAPATRLPVAGGAPQASFGSGSSASPAPDAGSANQTGSANDTGSALPAAPASIAASIHPATIPLVRQQLDLLATDQFRWTGEVWPGAKFDWTIEPDSSGRGRGGGADPGEEGQTWRTRVTLALPTLGTVDAELTLSGVRLAARVHASPGGAVRLAAQGDAFRRRLEAAGIELAGLSIREIGGAPAAGVAAGAQAAAAYARSAAAAADAEAHDKPASHVAGATGESAVGTSSATPLDRLFGDPLDWGGV
jgi:hypothetical protein